MDPVRSGFCCIALCVAITLLGCDGESHNNGSSLRSDHLQVYGLVPSRNFIEVLDRAVLTANAVLRLGTPHVLSKPNAPRDGEISVFLVSGDSLGEREFAFVIPDMRAIIVNADAVLGLAGTFDVPGKFLSRQTITSADATVLSNLLALVLLHEVGHVQQLDAPGSANQPVDWSKVTALAGPSRNRELDADYFAGRQLAASWELLEELQRDPARFVRDKRATGADARMLSDLHDTLSLALESISKRDSFALVSSYSHLDNDLRLLVYWTLARTRGSMADLVKLELARRQKLDKFRRTPPTSSQPSTGDESQPSRFQRYIDALKNSDPQVRAGAAIDLRTELRSLKLQPQELLPVLVDSINQRYGETPGITYILQAYGSTAVPSLIESLARANPRIREAAALCLAQMGREKAREAEHALRKALMDTDPNVRIRARTALGIPATDSLQPEQGTR